MWSTSERLARISNVEYMNSECRSEEELSLTKTTAESMISSQLGWMRIEPPRAPKSPRERNFRYTLLGVLGALGGFDYTNRCKQRAYFCGSEFLVGYSAVQILREKTRILCTVLRRGPRRAATKQRGWKIEDGGWQDPRMMNGGSV